MQDYVRFFKVFISVFSVFNEYPNVNISIPNIYIAYNISLVISCHLVCVCDGSCVR